MRDRRTLLELEDITTLWQYLYMDGEHTVTIKNCIDVPLELFMKEDGTLMMRNLNFPHVPAHPESFGIPEWLGIIDQLKGQPLKEMAGWNVDKDVIKNRWDEIKILTQTNMSLNR